MRGGWDREMGTPWVSDSLLCNDARKCALSRKQAASRRTRVFHSDIVFLQDASNISSSQKVGHTEYTLFLSVT